VAPSSRVRTWATVAAIAAAAVAACALSLGRTLSPDEAGLLIIAEQWAPGTSLYGDYWVDRPPLLLMIVALLPVGAGPEALRALGLVVVAVSVLLAGAVGRVAARRSTSAPVLTAGTAALLVSTPLFGGGEVAAELLGLPFVLAGTACALAWADAVRDGRGTVALLARAAGAGSAGAAAILVKQNLVDVAVLVLVLVLLGARALPPRRDGRPAPRLLLAAGSILGGVVTAVVVLTLAWARGTDPLPLWEAVMGFRSEALAVILDDATGATVERLLRVPLVVVLSGVPVLVVLLVRRARRGTRSADEVALGAAVTAVLTWEVLAVLLGGSYWLHYLVGLVPGMVLLAALAARHPPSRALHGGYALAALSTVVAVTWTAAQGQVVRIQDPAIDFLAGRVEPGDTGVVAFGSPNVLRATGLTSPYEHLWSLPVRVRDPRLLELAALLEGPERPTWVVLTGSGLATWGVDATAAEVPLRRHYELVGTVDGFTVLRLDDLDP
jgi:hypothetical protein